MKRLKAVNGKVEAPRDLEEIVYGKRVSKFKNYKSRKEYETALYGMNGVDLMQELIRVGVAPSYDKEVGRKRCLIAYDKAKAPRQHSISSESYKSLDDILRG